MKEKWNFNNPKDALQSYYDEEQLYNLKKKDYEKLQLQEEMLKKKLETNKTEVEKLEEKTAAYQKNSKNTAEAKNNKEEQRSVKLKEAANKSFESDKAELLKEQNVETEKNRSFYQEKMDRLTKSESLVIEELSPKAEKALELEKEKHAYYEEITQRLRAGEQSYLEDMRSAEAEIAGMEAEMKGLIEQYEPGIAEAKRAIEAKIEEKEAELLVYHQNLAEEEALRAKELQALELEKERLNLQDAKSDAHTERAAAYKVRLEATEKTTSERVGAKKAELQTKLAESEAGLGHQKAELGKLISDRDAKIKELELKIADLRKVEAEKEGKFKAGLAEEKKLEQDKKAEVEKTILTYARSQGIDHSDNYSILLGQFKSLQAKTELWKSLVNEIEMKNRDQVFELELVKQRQELDKLSYSALEEELKKAQSFRDKVSLISKKPLPFAIFGAFVAVFGLVVFGFSFFKGIQNPQLQMGGGMALTLLGLVFLIYVLRKPKKDVKKLCRYISLSQDNEGFSAIEKQAISNTEDQEVSSIKETGELLWLKNLGQGGLKAAKEKREAELTAFYEARLEILERRKENKLAEIERGRLLEIDKNELKAFLDGSTLDLNRLGQLKELSYVKREGTSVEELLSFLNSEKTELQTELSGFEANYAELLRQLKDKTWTAPKIEGREDFETELYLIKNEAEASESQPLMMQKLKSYQGPILISYDSYLLNHESKLIAADLSKLMMGFVKGFYRLNGAKGLSQFVYGDVEGLKAALNQDVEGGYLLKEVIEKPEDIETVSQAPNQDYNILYYVFKPQDGEGRIEEDGLRLMNLLKEKSNKAFIPVYICYYSALEDSKNLETAEYKKYRDEARLVLHYSSQQYKVEKE